MVTPFQKKVYEVCKLIPKGKVTTYKIVAEKLKIKAYRAIGNALRKNKDISVPCHRVVKSDGTVGGYEGKINNKKKIVLLKKEGIKIKNNKILNFKSVLHKF